MCVCIFYSWRIPEIIHYFDKKLAKSSESSVNKGKKPVDGKSAYIHVCMCNTVYTHCSMYKYFVILYSYGGTYVCIYVYTIHH